jgi:hypothetical protein
MSEDRGLHGRDAKEGTIACDACAVGCRISPGGLGAGRVLAACRVPLA